MVTISTVQNVTSEKSRVTRLDIWFRNCRDRFSLTSHTCLTHCRFPLEQLWILLWCWISQVPIRQTGLLTQLSEPTVRLWFASFRTNLPEEVTILDHFVQLDEAYFQGRKKSTNLNMVKQWGERKLAYQLIQGGYPVREHA